MYPVGVFLFVAVIDMFLTWYGVVENGADYYKDLIAVSIATFLSVYLAVASVSGTVLLTSAPSYLQDAGLMWLGIIVATAQGYITVMAIMEAVEDYRDQKREKLMQL
jgi:arginine exporter protein ArgO